MRAVLVLCGAVSFITFVPAAPSQAPATATAHSCRRTAPAVRHDAGGFNADFCALIQSKRWLKSGAFISESLVLTSSGMAVEGEYVTVFTTAGARFEGIVTRTGRYSALVDIKGRHASYIDISKQSEIEVGSPVVLLGDAMLSIKEDLKAAMFAALVSSKLTLHGVTLLTADLPRLQTLDGAPIFDTKGSFAGIYLKPGDDSYAVIPQPAVAGEIGDIETDSSRGAEAVTIPSRAATALDSRSKKATALIRSYEHMFVPLLIETESEQRAAAAIGLAPEIAVMPLHLADKAKKISLPADGPPIEFAIAGRDVERDLAFLRAPDVNFTICLEGCKSIKPAYGMEVFILGRGPSGSAITRQGVISTPSVWLASGFQTDLNSQLPPHALYCGVVVDENGAVAGIIQQRPRDSGDKGACGLTYDAVFASLDKFRAGIKTTRPAQGKLGLSLTAELVVSGVEAGSRAERLGVKQGDRIIKANGVPVTSLAEFRSAVSKITPVESLVVVREGKELRLELSK